MPVLAALLPFNAFASCGGGSGFEGWANSFPKTVVETYVDNKTLGLGSVAFGYAFGEEDCSYSGPSPLQTILSAINTLEGNIEGKLDELAIESDFKDESDKIRDALTDFNKGNDKYVSYKVAIEYYESLSCKQKALNDSSCAPARQYSLDAIKDLVTYYDDGLLLLVERLEAVRVKYKSESNVDIKLRYSSLLRQINQLIAMNATFLAHYLNDYKEASKDIGGLVNGTFAVDPAIATYIINEWNTKFKGTSEDEHIGTLHSILMTVYKEMRAQIKALDAEKIIQKTLYRSYDRTWWEALYDGNTQEYIMPFQQSHYNPTVEEVRIAKQRELYLQQLYVRAGILPLIRKIEDESNVDFSEITPDGDNYTKINTTTWFYRVERNYGDARGENDEAGRHDVIFRREAFAPVSYMKNYLGLDDERSKYEWEYAYIEYLKRRENLFARFSHEQMEFLEKNGKYHYSWQEPSKRGWEPYYNPDKQMALLAQRNETWSVSPKAYNNSNMQLGLNGYFDAGDLSFDYKVTGEVNGDIFDVYIDGARVINTSGVNDWRSYSKYLHKGFHSISFMYRKNGNDSGESEQAWIANFIHPTFKPTRWLDKQTIKSPNNLNFGGNWYMEVCPYGTYVSGMQAAIEPAQGGGDDSAMEALRLFCSNFDGDVITSIEIKDSSSFGYWGDRVDCPIGAHAKSFRARAESRQGGDDDTGMNSVEFECGKPNDESTTETIRPSNERYWGSWSSRKSVSGKAICGVEGKIEPSQGSGDDTGLHSLEFIFCGYDGYEKKSDEPLGTLFAEYDNEDRVYDVAHPQDANLNDSANPVHKCVTVGGHFPSAFHGDYVFDYSFNEGRPRYQKLDGKYRISYHTSDTRSAWRFLKPKWVPSNLNEKSFYWSHWWKNSAITVEQSDSAITPCD